MRLLPQRTFRRRTLPLVILVLGVGFCAVNAQAQAGG